MRLEEIENERERVDRVLRADMPTGENLQMVLFRSVLRDIAANGPERWARKAEAALGFLVERKKKKGAANG